MNNGKLKLLTQYHKIYMRRCIGKLLSTMHIVHSHGNRFFLFAAEANVRLDPDSQPIQDYQDIKLNLIVT